MLSQSGQDVVSTKPPHIFKLLLVQFEVGAGDFSEAAYHQLAVRKGPRL